MTTETKARGVISIKHIGTKGGGVRINTAQFLQLMDV